MNVAAPIGEATSGTEAPRVSVITIFRNEETYIREAIDSVLAQSFDDFELLLVDDGSTDSSPGIAQEYESRDPLRIRYLHHPDHSNRGMSATRNLGLSQARGEFVAFIDADDRWRPAKLEEQVALLNAMPHVDAIGGSVNYWASHNGGKDRVVPTAHLRNRPIAPGEATIELYPLGRAHAPSMSDFMFRRASILKVGGFEEAFTGAYEDQAFLSKFYLESTLYVTDALWSDYRLHPASCMAEVRLSGAYDESRLKFLEWFERYLARSRRDNGRAARALQKALKPYRRRNLREKLSDTPAGSLVRAAKAGFRRLRPLLAPGPAILMYHRVADESFDPWGLAVSPANFADQLGWIARNRTPLSLPEFVELNRQGRLPRNAVAVTFDDGYACNLQVAKPLLEQHRIPSTIFLSPALVERGGEFWWDDLQRIVMGHEGDTLALDGREIGLGVPEADDEFWLPAAPAATARQRAYHQIWSRLYDKAPVELEAAMAELRKQSGTVASPRESHRPLSPKEIAAVKSDLIEFGSHALSHPSLPLLREEEKKREISCSVERCTELTGSPPRSFAYPYGNSDPESVRLVEQAGFTCACRADGWFVTRKSNPFALPRIFVWNWDSGKLAQQLGRP